MPLDPLTIRIESEFSPSGVEAAKDGTRQLGSEADKASDKLDGVTTSLSKVDGAGPDKATSSVQALGSQLETTLQKVQGLQGGIDTLAQKFGGVASGAIRDFAAANRDGAQALSVLQSKGLDGYAKTIQESTDKIANLRGLDNDDVFAQVSESIAKGRVTALSSLGIQVSDEGKEAIAQAGKISESAKSLETYKQTMLAMSGAIATLTANTDPALAKVGELDNRLGDLSEKSGEGAIAVKAFLEGGILEPLIAIAEKNPEVVKGLGAVAEAGGTAFGAISTGLDWTAKISQSFPAFKSAIDWIKGIRTARVADAETAVTSATTTVAAATAENTAILSTAGMAEKARQEFTTFADEKLRAAETSGAGSTTGLVTEADLVEADARAYRDLKTAKTEAAATSGGGAAPGVLPTGASAPSATTAIAEVEKDAAGAATLGVGAKALAGAKGLIAEHGPIALVALTPKSADANKGVADKIRGFLEERGWFGFSKTGDKVSPAAISDSKTAAALKAAGITPNSTATNDDDSSPASSTLLDLQKNLIDAKAAKDKGRTADIQKQILDLKATEKEQKAEDSAATKAAKEQINAATKGQDAAARKTEQAQKEAARHAEQAARPERAALGEAGASSDTQNRRDEALRALYQLQSRRGIGGNGGFDYSRYKPASLSSNYAMDKSGGFDSTAGFVGPRPQARARVTDTHITFEPIPLDALAKAMASRLAQLNGTGGTRRNVVGR